MGLVPVRACGGSVRSRNCAGHKVPASEMADSRCGSGHSRQSDCPRVSLSDRRGRRSGSRLCHGMIAAHPWREWRSSAGMAVCRMTPFFVATLAFVWTIVHLPSETWPFQQLLWGGLLLTLAGLVGHVLWTGQSSWCPAWLSGPLARGLVGLGLGMTTGSLFITTTVLLVCAAHWLDGLPGQIRVHGGGPCGVMGGHDRGAVRRGHAAGAGGKLCPERHRADVVRVSRLSCLS